MASFHDTGMHDKAREKTLKKKGEKRKKEIAELFSRLAVGLITTYNFKLV